MATPRGSPSSFHECRTCRSEAGGGMGACAARRSVAAEQVSSPRKMELLLDRVGEVFDDGVREKSFTHLPQLLLEQLSGLLTVRKHDSKQLSHTHIFHAPEPERAQRVLDRLPLRVENGRFELYDDGRFHAAG